MSCIASSCPPVVSLTSRLRPSSEMEPMAASGGIIILLHKVTIALDPVSGGDKEEAYALGASRKLEYRLAREINAEVWVFVAYGLACFLVGLFGLGLASPFDALDIPAVWVGRARGLCILHALVGA